MKCPVCGDPAERGRPVDANEGWAREVEPERLKARHRKEKDALCPEMTSKGYRPALPR